MKEKSNSIDWKAIGIGLFLLAMLSIPFWMGLGKYQLCKYYFPEMNRMACFMTQLPAVMPRGGSN